MKGDIMENEYTVTAKIVLRADTEEKALEVVRDAIDDGLVHIESLCTDHTGDLVGMAEAIVAQDRDGLDRSDWLLAEAETVLERIKGK